MALLIFNIVTINIFLLQKMKQNSVAKKNERQIVFISLSVSEKVMIIVPCNYELNICHVYV